MNKKISNCANFLFGVALTLSGYSYYLHHAKEQIFSPKNVVSETKEEPFPYFLGQNMLELKCQLEEKLPEREEKVCPKLEDLISDASNINESLVLRAIAEVESGGKVDIGCGKNGCGPMQLTNNGANGGVVLLYSADSYYRKFQERYQPQMEAKRKKIAQYAPYFTELLTIEGALEKRRAEISDQKEQLKLERLGLMIQRGYLLTNDSAEELKVAYRSALGKVQAQKNEYNEYFNGIMGSGEEKDWVAVLEKQKTEVKNLFKLAMTAPELNVVFGDVILASYRDQQGKQKDTMDSMMKAAAAYNVGHFCGNTNYSYAFRRYYNHFKDLGSSVASN